MKLSADFSYDVIVKCWWLHGRGTNIMVATPSFLRNLLLSNKLKEPGQTIKIFQKFFLHVFISCKKLQKDVWNIFLSAISRELKIFPGAFQSVYFRSLCFILHIMQFCKMSAYFFCGKIQTCSFLGKLLRVCLMVSIRMTPCLFIR